MKDSIEEYIRQHREEFDVHTPREKVWQSIDSSLSRKRARRYTMFAAAAAVLLAIIGVFSLLNREGNNYSEHVVVVADYSLEIAEAEMYYAALVREKQAEMNEYRSDFPELVTEFANDVTALSSDYTMLKKEYVSSARRDIVKQAMIENLQAQVSMVDTQLDIIAKAKQKENNRI